MAWAIAYGLGSLVLLIGLTVYESGLDAGGAVTDIASLTAGDVLGGLGFVVLAVAAVLAIVVVRTLSRRQAAAFERDASAAPAGPAPGQAGSSHTWGQPAPPPPPPPPPPPGGGGPPGRPGWGTPT